MQELNQTQINLFNKLKAQLPMRVSLVDDLADLLQISNDSAYRRMRGETALTLDELGLLCKHYKLPVSEILGANSDAVVFSYKTIDSSEISLNKYLSPILADLKRIDQSPEKEIVYAAKDIPLFHHFDFPELAAFKIFFWMKCVLNCPSHERLQFDISEIAKEDIELGKEILNYYIKIPATEIWTEETLNSTLKQIEYCRESGFIKHKNDALQLCNQLSELMLHVQKQAELGVKFLYNQEIPAEEKNNFKLYFSEVMIGNNNILINLSGGMQLAYLTHNTLNYLITSDSSFCKETELSLKGMMKKSILLSGSSEKQRNIFFRNARQAILSVKEKMESEK